MRWGVGVACSSEGGAICVQGAPPSAPRHAARAALDRRWGLSGAFVAPSQCPSSAPAEHPSGASELRVRAARPSGARCAPETGTRAARGQLERNSVLVPRARRRCAQLLSPSCGCHPPLVRFLRLSSRGFMTGVLPARANKVPNLFRRREQSSVARDVQRVEFERPSNGGVVRCVFDVSEWT